MGILILTGMSGGGKTQAAKFLEDIGYFCIDNMPLKLFSKFGEMYRHSEIAQKKTAIVTDVRSGDDFSDVYKFIEDMKVSGETVKVVFVDCNESDRGYFDLVLLSVCRHQIASQGSFGKYAWLLNKYDEKCLVVPNCGIANELVETINGKNIIFIDLNQDNCENP